MELRNPPENESLTDRLVRYRQDPFAFASECVYTHDPKDRNNPIKPYPYDKEYLRLYCKIWMHERLVLIPKSRRLFMSWQNVILYTWDTMFFVGRHNAFVSKKEADADSLIERSKFIIDNIPPSRLPPEVIPAHKKTYTLLEFPGLMSKIQAFPSGSDQLRMHGFSGIFNDEMAFQDEAEGMYGATYPTIENGGRFTACSSAAKGFFHDLVHDLLEQS